MPKRLRFKQLRSIYYQTKPRCIAAGLMDARIEGVSRKPEVGYAGAAGSVEFKVKLIRADRRGVSAAQAARDLDVHENVLRKWVKEFGSDPVQAFPGQGQMKPEQLEIERLRREVNKLKAERDILKKAAAFFAREAT